MFFRTARRLGVMEKVCRSSFRRFETGGSQCEAAHSYPCPDANLPTPDPDWGFLSDPSNLERIKLNIAKRKSGADIDNFQQLYKEIYLNTFIHDAKSEVDQRKIEEACLSSALSIPNMCSPEVLNLGDTNKVIHQEGDTASPPFKIKTFEEIARILGGARLTNLSHQSGERTYYLTGHLAELEQALIHWTVDQLVDLGFSLVSVPDILHPGVISACGMQVDGQRTQVYHLDSYYGKAALSGTAEMALGGLLADSQVPRLPQQLCAVSRCYRAETSEVQEEKGLYRVHQFTKVEMFCATSSQESEATLDKILEIERQLFDKLGLVYRVLEMCAWELGDPASRKFDIEAWMPGRQGGFWGEISSCSNCTDYQARRLGLKGPDREFLHTVNGTACAVPRMLIALCEQNQMENGSVVIPEVLRPYMRGKDILVPLPKKKRPQFLNITSAKFFTNPLMRKVSK